MNVTGHRMREARIHAGLDQRELGHLIGVAQTSISGYEKGARKVPITLLPTIAESLGVSVDFLLGTDLPNDPPPPTLGLNWDAIAAKIVNLRKSRGWSVEDAAKTLKTTASQWLMWESGHHPISLDTLDRIAHVFSSSLAGLMEGAGRSPRPSDSGGIEARIRSVLPVKEIPILGRIVAGIPTDSQPDRRGSTWVSETVSGDFALEVHGDSMIGAGIYEGDYVVVQSVDAWQSVPADSMVVALVDSETTLKYLIRERDPIGGDQWYLRAANPAYPDRPINPSEDRVQGIVTSIQTVRPPTLVRTVPSISGEKSDPLAGLTSDQQILVHQMIEHFRQANKPRS